MSGKMRPNLDLRSAKSLNLTVLRRIDPSVVEILLTAGHVTMYTFGIEVNQWSRKDVEGSLFVVKRSTQPRFQFIVLNRRSTENLMEDLLGQFEFEVQVPYLFYRNASQEINGIWFYDSKDCEAVANLLTRILNAYSNVQPKLKVFSPKSEFEESEVKPDLSAIGGSLEPSTSSVAPTDGPDLSTIGGSLEPKASGVAPTDGVPYDARISFASTNLINGNTSDTSIAGRPTLPSKAIPLSSNIQTLPAFQSAPGLPTPSIPLVLPIDSHGSCLGSRTFATNLVKPSFFLPSASAALVTPSTSTSVQTAPPVHRTLSMQQPCDTPLLQPFPRPTRSASLARASNYDGLFITKDRVRDILLRLVQNDGFIDMIYREMLNGHHL